MNRTLLSVAAIAALAFIGLSAGLRMRAAGTTAATEPRALPLGTSLDRRTPAVPLRDAGGQTVSLRALRGRWLALAPTATSCREVCPLTIGALLELRSRLRSSGLAHRVAIVAVSVDPWRDTPRRLRAYRRLAGAELRMWTGSVASVRRFWRFFGVHFQRRRSEVEHGDGLFLLGPGGHERVAIAGPPELSGHLGPRLRRLLDARGRTTLEHARAGWSVDGVLADLGRLTGARGLVPPSRGGSGRLLESRSLSGRLNELRGSPVVLNAWASWCPPCREELPLFSAASSRFGARVAFLGADVEDDAESARRLLAAEHPAYPSYAVSLGEVRTIAPARGTPVTIYLGPSRQLLYEHIGAYPSQADLDRDIRRYALGAES